MTFEPIVDIPQYIFGPHSSLCQSSEAVARVGGGVTSAWLAVVIVAMAVTYLMWINHWSARGSNHLKLFKFLGTHRGEYSEKVEFLSASMNNYLQSGNSFGLAVMWLASFSFVKYHGLDMGVNEWQLCSGILLSIAILCCYQNLIITLIGKVTQSQDLCKMLLYIKRISFAIFILLATPTILCYALANQSSEMIIMCIVAVEILIALIIFIYESFLLFIKKKVSLLHTILYLCSVEIFPLTLIWGLFCR